MCFRLPAITKSLSIIQSIQEHPTTKQVPLYNEVQVVYVRDKPQESHLEGSSKCDLTKDQSDHSMGFYLSRIYCDLLGGCSKVDKQQHKRQIG